MLFMQKDIILRQVKRITLFTIMFLTVACGSNEGSSDVGPIANTPLPSIHTTSSPLHGGNILRSGTFNYGEQATLTADPKPGYIFSSWTENNKELSSSYTYSFIVNNDRVITANFKLQPPLNSTEFIISEWKDSYNIPLVYNNIKTNNWIVEIVEDAHYGKVTINEDLMAITYFPSKKGFFNDRISVRIFNGLDWSDEQQVDIIYIDSNASGVPDFIDPKLSNVSTLSEIIEEDTSLLPGIYLVEKNLQIRTGATLRLDPETILLFKDDVPLTVAGALIANGSHNNLIRFLPASINPKGWDGIHFIYGHEGTVMESEKYISGTLFKGVEISGIAENAGNAAISFCSMESQTYLFEEVLLHGMIGNSGVYYLGKCSYSKWPSFVINRSVIHIDDRNYNSGFPTQAFDSSYVILNDSVITGYVIASMIDGSNFLQVRNSNIQVKKAAYWAYQTLNFSYLRDSSSITNSVISGGILISGNFDHKMLNNNIFSAGDFDYLITVGGLGEDIDMGDNYYIFDNENNIQEEILDGRTDVSLSFIDLSNKLENKPDAGPTVMAKEVLDILLKYIDDH